MVKKKVFITGVGGLLGSTLARRLLVKGDYNVAGCDTFVGGIQSNVPDIPFQRCDERCRHCFSYGSITL